MLIGIGTEDVKVTIRRLRQDANGADRVSSVAIDQLAALLLQRMSELKADRVSA